eukprot:7377826-Pyramimonas_sp.AAC.2
MERERKITWDECTGLTRRDCGPAGGVEDSAVRTLYSRSMACADASNLPGGFFRSTCREGVPLAGVASIRYVGLDCPWPNCLMRKCERGASGKPGTWRWRYASSGASGSARAGLVSASASLVRTVIGPVKANVVSANACNEVRINA